MTRKYLVECKENLNGTNCKLEGCRQHTLFFINLARWANFRVLNVSMEELQGAKYLGYMSAALWRTKPPLIILSEKMKTGN